MFHFNLLLFFFKRKYNELSQNSFFCRFVLLMKVNARKHNSKCKQRIAWLLLHRNYAYGVLLCNHGKLLKLWKTFKKGKKEKLYRKKGTNGYCDSVYNFRDAFMMLVIKMIFFPSFYVFYSLRVKKRKGREMITQLGRVYVHIIFMLILSFSSSTA